MRFLKIAVTFLLLAGGALGAERLSSGAPAADDAVVAAFQNAVQVPTPVEPAPPPQAAPDDAAPGAGAEAAAVAPSILRLRDDLTRVVSRSTTGAQVGVMVVSLEHGDTLFALNADVPLAPASNMKLYSTAAALYYLGPEFRYSTYVLGTGPVVNGVLQGDLILYGTGDPTMSTRMLSGPVTPLRALADSLRARGIVAVQGDVVGDGSYFDAEWLGRGWSQDNFGAWYSAPVGALSIAENVASVRVAPGAAAGTPARISTTPSTMGLAVVNETLTVPSGRSFVRFAYEPRGLVVRGQIARAHPGVAHSTSIVNPSNFTTAVFRNVLHEQGIQVAGGVRTVYTPDESPVTFAARAARNGSAANGGQGGAQPHPRVLAIHLSPPMSDLVSVTNHVSHNLFAEALLKTVGRVALGEGTFEAGSRAIRYFLECEAGIDTAAINIVDGSGLSPLNRVTARSTIQLLDMMTRNEHWETYLASLPESGRPRPRGLNRMLGTPAVGNLRAKTGTIRTVSSLSGYVNSAEGERLAFAIMANNLPTSTWLAKRIEDEIGIRLAEFRRTASVAPVADTAPRAAAQRQPAGPAATQPAARQGGRTHTVRPGETVDAIARRNNTTVRAIQQANPGLQPNRIRAGQTIRLP
jgi:serine-type D-Ala-D-Ala carboxypeptidase/endopeptidase (penicillin-binding protein 4)